MKVSKKAKRRVIVLTVIIVLIAGFFCFSVYKYWVDIFDNIKINKELTKRHENLLKDESELQAQVEKLEDPDYVAKYARENFLFSKDGETIIRIVE